MFDQLFLVKFSRFLIDVENKLHFKAKRFQVLYIILYFIFKGLEDEPVSKAAKVSNKQLKRTSGDASELVPDKKHKPTPKPPTKKSKIDLFEKNISVCGLIYFVIYLLLFRTLRLQWNFIL